MIKKLNLMMKLGAFCLTVGSVSPVTALAAIGPGFTAGTYVATVTADSVNINKSQDSEEVLLTAEAGDEYEVLEDLGNGWVRVQVMDTEGYLPVSENAEISQVDEDEMEAIQNEALTSSMSYKRQQLVDYALQFLGGSYRYGGSDPNTGVDCSGFIRYIMQNGAGVSMNRSSGSQAQQGSAISADEMQPGDLIFYGSGSRINHVGMYIGNGQIVHASTEATGIKLSPWNYRTPVKITNVLG
ncbi:MAG TPA: C40 family peptidase [Candidatus Enterocloster faecavium]|uniref:C40 family peptidase n=1 Tax=Candidatus Enterocloster faecavium TaxID=2838560 RepID=A0A9D2L5J4_9FIRM|nr:C40 family peptidase [Candidatus Enterocloster faecavium]